ncbi:ribbon-helix-helix domain-containing protein [Pseudoroseomonas globiformis]|uniref:Ribbon-helix-helix domain-containing protein n=1 Tax=Teichococcus globiformis TaxID=2307229 RepID=A0ABV7G435_9PROT
MALRSRPKLNSLPRPALAQTDVVPSAPVPNKVPVPPSRQGKRQVAFFVDTATKRQLDRMGLDEGKRIQHLMTEALNLLFQSRGLARIAETKD